MPDAATCAFLRNGWAVVPASPASRAWAAAAQDRVPRILADPANAKWYRHGATWFVGVDVLDNAEDGALGPVALAGPALTLLGALGYPVTHWHSGQLSVLFPGYPARDPGESDGAARFRRNRDAAHVDGLLPIGPDRQRMLKEPHAFILGFPLSEPRPGASALTVWEGSHRSIGNAFRAALADVTDGLRGETDLTAPYHAARRAAFETCRRLRVEAAPGEAIILHRHMLHGISPWEGPADRPRAVAYFRPQITISDWLTEP